MYAEHLCVSVSPLPQEKAQQRLQGRRMQRCLVQKRAAAWHLQIHTVRGHIRRADWSPAPPAGTASVQSQLYPFPSSRGTSPTGNSLKTLKSQVAQESLSDLLFPNFPFLLLPVPYQPLSWKILAAFMIAWFLQAGFLNVSCPSLTPSSSAAIDKSCPSSTCYQQKSGSRPAQCLCPSPRASSSSFPWLMHGKAYWFHTFHLCSCFTSEKNAISSRLSRVTRVLWTMTMYIAYCCTSTPQKSNVIWITVLQ